MEWGLGATTFSMGNGTDYRWYHVQGGTIGPIIRDSGG